jgi:hypothetical protein
MPLPLTVNLMALAIELERRGGKRKLAGVLRSAWRAQSCLADLNQVRDILVVLVDLRPSAPSMAPSAFVQVQSALMTSAILLYARATSTGGSSTERGSIRIVSSLTPEQRVDHKTLVDIRNRALGHVEHSASIEGDFWHAVYLFAKRVRNGTWGFASASTSIGLNFDTVAILNRQLPVAIDIIRERVRERLDHVHRAFQEMNPTEDLMLRHEVNPIDWFGSQESARMFLAGDPGDETSTWIPLI